MYLRIALSFFLAFVSASNGVAAVQPMLLTPGSFVLEQGKNVIQISAQCLNEHLAIPGKVDVFDHFSDGVTVTRVIGNERQTVKLSEAVDRKRVTPKGLGNFADVGIEVNPEELEKGVTFQVDVKGDTPQFVATGTSQVDDVKRLLERGGSVIQDADQIVERFISDQLPDWTSFLGYSDDSIRLDILQPKLKRT